MAQAAISKSTAVFEISTLKFFKMQRFMQN